MVFAILRMVTMPRNLVETLIKNSAVCLNQNLKSYLCPTQCIDCGLTRVFTSLGQKNLILLLGIHSCNEHKKCQNGAFSMPQCSLMSMCTPLFYFKIEVLM